MGFLERIFGVSGRMPAFCPVSAGRGQKEVLVSWLTLTKVLLLKAVSGLFIRWQCRGAPHNLDLTSKNIGLITEWESLCSGWQWLKFHSYPLSPCMTKARPQSATKHQCIQTMMMKLFFFKLQHDNVRMKRTHFGVCKPVVCKAMCLKMCIHGQVRVCFKSDCHVRSYLLIHGLHRNEVSYYTGLETPSYRTVNPFKDHVSMTISPHSGHLLACFLVVLLFQYDVKWLLA